MKAHFFVLISFFSGITYAQEERIVVIRDSKPAHAPKNKDGRNVENYNAIKFDPLRMTTGEIGFSWETRIQDKTSLEFELGPTISGIGSNRFYYNANAESRFGGLVSAAVRYYPIEGLWAMNKLYVSPKLKYRRFNYLSTASEFGLSDQKGYSNDLEFSFNVGYQLWVSSNFAFDFYTGLGIGSAIGRQNWLNSVYDGTTGQYVYSWNTENFNNARLIGVIGMKVSIGN